MTDNDPLGVHGLVENAEDDKVVRIHIRGEQQGWVSGKIDRSLTDDDALFLIVGHFATEANFRVCVDSIDAIDYQGAA